MQWRISLDSPEMKALAWGGLSLACVGWILMVVGISGLQHYCQHYRILVCAEGSSSCLCAA